MLLLLFLEILCQIKSEILSKKVLVYIFTKTKIEIACIRICASSSQAVPDLIADKTKVATEVESNSNNVVYYLFVYLQVSIYTHFFFVVIQK